MVTLSDKKIGHTTDNNTIDYYNADVVTANDYYPGGMQMPGRKYSQPNSNYRYGFNGKENDNDAGTGIQDYGMRIYSERLGRFLSVDPITKKYPGLTPYQFASNRPIDGIDLDGLEYISFFVRSYEHSHYFGFPMLSLGDWRSATTISTASARIHYTLGVDFNTKQATASATSSPTFQFFSLFSSKIFQQGKAVPEQKTTTDGKGEFNFKVAASNPVAASQFGKKVTPDIDFNGALKMTVQNAILNVKGSIKGDGFPDAESFIKDNSGQAIMLGTYEHGKLGSPMWSLFGNGDKKMIDINVKVNLSKEGNFSKAVSIDNKGQEAPLQIIAPEKPKP